MTRPSRLLLSAACLAVLALPACSGGDSGADDAAAVKAAYVQKASAVCDRASQERKALTTPTSAAGFAPYVRSLTGVAEKAQQDLAALTPPEPDRADLQSKLLDPLATSVEQGKEFATKVEAAGGDQAKLAGLLGQAPTGAGIDLDYLRSYGLTSCVAAISTTG